MTLKGVEVKLRSVKDLYLVKQMVCESEAEVDTKNLILETINKILMSEGGAKAVLFPYNALEASIIQLWKESTHPKDIARKLGIEDEEAVILVIKEAEEAKAKEGV